ncbi:MULTISPECIES: flagellar hook-associated protein FlgK [Bradyrhizobium]|uniref:Flagellar hook-associated protein 1 n=1 Tax=Bradyrhizobium diazoefficiens (strain JCM 10833 / BCRC 13528 / IAM 13628 / NBRC 14792 / USDA 110) TaxID=224911 RepID=Q89NY0_BRADU|nr:flagellar hook-associated protein FlgK [Bradyrhizobium diazoefficiens]MBP1066349.1 flagellar hook-associated protein 1 FlgK [Bradyrhizobium japonicum]AND89043.1 flagellar hook protein FlgK [Bradyrhizobium diazoefficiens USDA 110]AWO90649.1 flagellar hook-associated protein FlgK [Bradyrhizobium diazoefficiens]PDT60255.1 flagellar hook-associated protein FlgK [Bradyrhizobium diazoefficiens]QBP22476.1 flagellar hook-associated protein FlgK [Bradyrhizobium diazoefficiens]
MSLDITRLIAFSGLSATQVQISVTSSNISNADTTGYTTKTANQTSSVTNGVGTGVTVTGITSTVDKLLLKSLIGATSELGAADTSNTYLTSLQKLYGSTSTSDSSSTGTSLANTLADLESALSSLASTPSSASLQSNAVSALNDVVSQLRETSSGIQKLRSNADKDIASSVDDVNKDLQQIANVNAEIKQVAASGQSTADLEDQRNTALQDVASKMNVSYFTASNGDLQVYTTSGQALVDSSAHTISYTTAANVSSSTSFGAISVNGVDITSQITSGDIGALVTLRDKTLPAAQSQLDQLAQQFTSALNSVSNSASSVPPPTSLTGTTAVASTDALSATGTVHIAATDQSGNLVSYADLDLSSYATVGDLVTAINGISGLSASVDSNGHLTISATGSGNGVAINEMTSSVGSSGEGLSDYFGLNDIVTGTSAADIAVKSSFLSGSSELPLATLDSSSTLTVGSRVLSSGSATVVNNLYDTLTGSRSFASAGGLAESTGSFADYAATIVSDVASKASQASSAYTAKETAQSTYADSLSSQSGVNLDEESARLSTLQNKYSAASALIQAINTMYSALLNAVQSG